MYKLEIDSVQLSFGYRQILTDCYLSCSSGEIIGILGRNGSGKSSLFEIIFGTLKPSNKFFSVNGQPCNNLFKSKLVGYLPQGCIFPKDDTIKELLKFLLDKVSIEKIKTDKRIGSMYTSKVRGLSGGELKYLEVLIMLNMNHPFLLLDEPFSGIEPIYQIEILNLIKQNPCKKGILISDHSYRNIMAVSHKLFLLKDGVLKQIIANTELETHGYVPVGTFTDI